MNYSFLVFFQGRLCHPACISTVLSQGRALAHCWVTVWAWISTKSELADGSWRPRLRKTTKLWFLTYLVFSFQWLQQIYQRYSFARSCSLLSNQVPIYQPLLFFCVRNHHFSEGNNTERPKDIALNLMKLWCTTDNDVHDCHHCHNYGLFCNRPFVQGVWLPFRKCCEQHVI